jgi:hypothetical protein
MGPVIADPAKETNLFSKGPLSPHKTENRNEKQPMSLPFISPFGLTITPALSANAV